MPSGWRTRDQKPLALTASVPVPDLTVVRSDPDSYTNHHPIEADTALVVEVSDTSLLNDRANNRAIYAREAIPIYWIVNVVAGQVEVYSQPRDGSYSDHTDYRPADLLPLVFAGVEVAQLPAADLLPRSRGDGQP